MRIFTPILMFLLLLGQVDAQDVKIDAKLRDLSKQLSEKRQLLLTYSQDLQSYKERMVETNSGGLNLEYSNCKDLSHIVYERISSVDAIWNYCYLFQFIEDKKARIIAASVMWSAIKGANMLIDGNITYINGAFDYAKHGGIIQTMNDFKKTLRELLEINNKIIKILESYTHTK